MFIPSSGAASPGARRSMGITTHTSRGEEHREPTSRTLACAAASKTSRSSRRMNSSAVIDRLLPKLMATPLMK